MWQADALVPPLKGHTTPSAPRSSFQRADSLRRLATETFDVLVIGGGITGAGVALDAASRGLKTALVERHDFASGTSSKSSKMVHGGLRYLQQHDFRLVYEALHERQILLDNAPHLVTPLPFLIPLFGRDGVVNKTVARTYSTALWLYDLTGGWRIGKRHKRMSKAEALRHFPTLNADRLVAAFEYYDARADDARLTLTVLRTAAIRYGVACANYAEVRHLLHRSDGHAAGAVVRAAVPTTAGSRAAAFGSADSSVPEGTGATGWTEFEVTASVVVNATGVWADDVRALDEKTHPHSLRPAKGIHITVPRSRLPADMAAVFPVRSDRRSVFVVPWPDGDDVYLGTTDTDWEGPLDDPACLPEDVDYMLEAANGSTTSDLTRADVTGVWAGLRPLLAPEGRQLSARTADLSRRHTVRVSDHGVVTVTGGKLTTYRLMAEQTVDAAIGALPSKSRTIPKSRTRNLKLVGSPENASDVAALASPAAASRLGVSLERLAALVHRHGTAVDDVLALASGHRGLLEPLVPGLPYLKVEAVWAVREEMAVTVEDVLSRRTRSVLRRAKNAEAAAGLVARLMASESGEHAALLESQAEGFKKSVTTSLERAGLPMAGAL